MHFLEFYNFFSEIFQYVAVIVVNTVLVMPHII